MSSSAKASTEIHVTVPIIFVPKADATQSRRTMAEELISSLLRDEKILRTLQESKI